ncbi:MAG: potassium transporter Kef [Caulobacter sp.]|nr:potassium transporter Kef [Caulobacter sp.]
MADLYALLLSLVLIAGAVLIHFRALRMLSHWQGRVDLSRNVKVLTIIFGLIAAHALEALLFSIGYGFGVHALKLGTFVGQGPINTAQLFYFSIETYTTQGVGDVYLTGPLRLVASLEPLVGLILIGWSTSFTFLIMGIDWRMATDRRGDAGNAENP